MLDDPFAAARAAEGVVQRTRVRRMVDAVGPELAPREFARRVEQHAVHPRERGHRRHLPLAFRSAIAPARPGVSRDHTRHGGRITRGCGGVQPAVLAAVEWGGIGSVLHGMLHRYFGRFLQLTGRNESLKRPLREAFREVGCRDFSSFIA